MTTVDEPEAPAFDPDALRDKYRAERDKRLRPDGNDQYVEIAGPVRPLPRRPVRRADRARPADRRGRRRRHRRRLRRPARRRPPQGGRHHRRPHHREGRRLRRHVVLEPLPGRAVRHRVVHLPAAARGDRLRPEGEVHPGARDPRAQPQHRQALRPLRRGAVPDRGHDADVGRRRRRAGSWRRTAATSCGPGSSAWRAARCTARSCPASPASRASRATRSTPAAGTTTTRAATPRGTSRSSPASASASSAPAPPPCRSCPHVGAAAEQLYVFQRTPSSIDVRNNRPTDPEWAASLEPGWQQRRMENFNNLVSGIPEPEDLVNDGWTDIIGKLLAADAPGARAPTGRRAAWPRPSSSPTSTRWSRSGPASTPSSTTRTRPRR